MVQSSDIVEIKPPPGLEGFFRVRPRRLWVVGNLAILNRPLLGIISARQIDSDLALKNSGILKQLSSLKEIAFIGGWHSPLEEEALHILLAQGVSTIFCASKSLNRVIPSGEIARGVEQGEILLLTHCSPKAKRISREASIRRNQLVVSLAKALLLLSAPAGSASANLAKWALRKGKPVFTSEHSMNKQLLDSGAVPASLEAIENLLR